MESICELCSSVFSLSGSPRLDYRNAACFLAPYFLRCSQSALIPDVGRWLLGILFWGHCGSSGQTFYWLSWRSSCLHFHIRMRNGPSPVPSLIWTGPQKHWVFKKSKTFQIDNFWVRHVFCASRASSEQALGGWAPRLACRKKGVTVTAPTQMSKLTARVTQDCLLPSWHMKGT